MKNSWLFWHYVGVKTQHSDELKLRTAFLQDRKLLYTSCPLKTSEDSISSTFNNCSKCWLQNVQASYTSLIESKSVTMDHSDSGISCQPWASECIWMQAIKGLFPPGILICVVIALWVFDSLSLNLSSVSEIGPKVQGSSVQGNVWNKQSRLNVSLCFPRKQDPPNQRAWCTHERTETEAAHAGWQGSAVDGVLELNGDEDTCLLLNAKIISNW